MNTLKELSENRPIVILGAKNTGIDFYHLLKRHNIHNFLFYVDNKIQNDKTVSIESFCDYLRKCDKKPYAIIASRFMMKDFSDLCDVFSMKYTEDYCKATDYLGPSYQIDLHNRCNLKCPSCPQGNYTPQGKQEFMPFDKFTSIVDKILLETPNLSNIALYCWSEPFLRTDLKKFIEYVQEKNISLQLSTNLNHDFDIRQIVSLNIDYLRISTSGYYFSTYNRDHPSRRERESYHVISNLRELRRHLDELKCSTLVDIAFHKYKYNIGDDLEKMKLLSEELHFYLTPFNAVPLPIENYIRLCQNDTYLYKKMECQKFINDPISIVRDHQNFKYENCSFANAIAITPSGALRVCCGSFDKKNILTDDICGIKISDIRATREKHKLCKDCRRFGIPHAFETVVS